MSTRIKLLGKPTVEVDGQTSAVQNSTKGMALLAYLLVTRQAHTREGVADLLWEATSTAKSLNNLRQLLSRLRKWLPDLQVSATEVAYEATGFVDFYALIGDLTAVSPHTLDQALKLYQGELLEGLYLPDAPRFNEWLLLEREQLRQQVTTAYEQLCHQYAEQENWVKGIAIAQRWLALDELDETALQYLLQFLAASGQIELALQQYEISRQRLWVELEVEPEPKTVQLIQRLQALKEKQGGGLSWAVILGAQVERPSPHQLAAPGTLPTNAYVPYQRNNDFTGRKQSLLYLANLLLPQLKEGKHRAVAVTGMGGLGKTQIAVEFCYRYGRYFPGGVYWLSFADGNNVAAEVAHVGGERGMGLYREADNLRQADKVGRVTKAWQEPIPRLLVFDNCEAEDLLAKWLPVSGGCSILLTSRRANWTRELQVVERPLSVLDLPESVAFLQRLVPSLTANEAAKIGTELGQLPLALHLAGGFLHRYQRVSADHYLSQLRDKGLMQHPSLIGWGTHHSPTGHELNVFRTFAINLELLDPADEIDSIARQLLARAACFAPNKPIPKDLLFTTVSLNDNDLMAHLLAEDGLERLISLGFLQRQEHQAVVIHRLVAAFTNETIGNHEEAVEAVENTLVNVLGTRLKQTGHLGQLPIASRHLLHVTNSALSTMDSMTVRLGTLLGRHLRDVADYDGARAILEQILAISGPTEDREMLANAWVGLARVQRSLGKDQDSLNSAEQAEHLLRTADSPSPNMLIHVLHRKGWSLFMLGRAKEAIAAAEEALSLSKTNDSHRGMISNLNLLGQIHSHILEQYDLAIQFINEALVIAQKMKNIRAEAALINNLGEIAERQGDFEKAYHLYQKAITLSDETGNQDKEIVYRANLGRAQVLLGTYDDAVVGLEGLINILPQSSYLLAEILLSLAGAYLGRGQFDLAATAGKQALIQATSNTKLLEIGWVWVILGRIAAQLKAPLCVDHGENSHYDAPACFQKSLEIFTNLQLARDRAFALWHWAQYELMKGNVDEAEQMWLEARGIFESLNLPLLVGRMDRGLGQVD